MHPYERWRNGCLETGVKLKEYQSKIKFTISCFFIFVFWGFYFGYYDIKHLPFFILFAISFIPSLQAETKIIWVVRHYIGKDTRIR